MDKNAIKKYAIWARNELIAKVSQKAAAYGIEKDNIVDANADSIDGEMLSSVEKKQRKALIEHINEKGYEQVIEEVAYTWFNRFTAIRFMEVNGYLPSHIRVFTDDDNNFKPQILAEAIHLNDVFEKINMDKVLELKQEDKTEELYKYLLIIQCNALNEILPRMFQKIEDYTELLLPDNILREGSVIEHLVSDIEEADFNVHSGTGQVEIIGWLYQYYNDEKKAAIIDMAGKTAIKKEDIPAATQLFTTDWVVRYIVDNSLGRYWLERHPNSRLKDYLEYYVEPKENKMSEVDISPEKITFFDPCIGSGHFALYAFSVYMQIYAECGYSEREAVTSIIENNIYGLDIDDRAAQLAYFSVMMKAREYDRRFFSKRLQPHITSIAESNLIDSHIVYAFAGGDSDLKKEIMDIVEEMRDAKNLGSLIRIKNHDFAKLKTRLSELKTEISLFNDQAVEVLRPILESAEILSKTYTIVATNPPYLNKYNDVLKSYLYSQFKNYSGDLFSVFIYRNFAFCEKDGYTGFMTPFVWMFIKLYQKLREFIVNEKSIVTLVQMEYSAFEEATVPICAFVLQNGKKFHTGYYFQLSDFKGGMAVQKEKVLEALSDVSNCNYFYETPLSSFLNIPASPITYWANDKVLESFRIFKPLGDYAEIVSGMTTGNNDKYMRDWREVNLNTIAFNKASLDKVDLNKTYWFPYNKGGAFRRWYGNNDFVVNWSKSHEFNRAKTTMTYLYLKPCITWSDITSAVFSARACGQGFFFDVKGSCAFPDEKTYYPLIAFLNSKIAMMYIKMLNPTISTQVGDLKRIPFNPAAYDNHLIELAKRCIELGKIDYDSFELSWNFEMHPFVKYGEMTIEKAFDLWADECKKRFIELKKKEGEINRFFIELYDMGRYMTEDNEDKYVSIHLADSKTDIISFISYAVGCMFGRYSLDVSGLTYAGGEWDSSKYKTFQPDKDAIIPICDDEYFDDDIVGRFVKFVEVVYGKDKLEDNLKFIADALGGNGTSREIIRNYFINDFYSDHVKSYQKRPIYWLFDSGKKNGFKCLIYMHRYQPDTIARIRTDYVHEQQSRYKTSIADLESRIVDSSASDRIKLNKRLDILKAQDEELRIYEEKIHHLADQMIEIDLDDGVKVNYAKFQDVLAKIK